MGGGERSDGHGDYHSDDASGFGERADGVRLRGDILYVSAVEGYQYIGLKVCAWVGTLTTTPPPLC